MLKKNIYLLLCILGLMLMMLFTGCATSYYSQGHSALEEQEYDTAIQNLKLAIADDFYNVEAIRDMGIAVYHKGNKNLAQKFLRLAQTRLTDDPVIFYYRGMIYEEQGQIDNAIKMYSSYADVSPLNSLRKEIEGRLLVLLREQMKASVKQMVDMEQALDTQLLPDDALAVLYFTNTTGEEQLALIQKGLVDMIITDLSQVESLTLVERARLQELMDEIGLGMTGMVDESTAARMGKLLGASQVVHGTILGLGDNMLRIDAGLTNIKLDDNQTADKVTGSMKDFFHLEKDIVFEIIDMMKIPLTFEERQAIEKIPTSNLLAFMSYCRGLDYEDKGLWTDAQFEYQNAVNIDPAFNAAQTGVDRSQAFSSFTAVPPEPTLAEVTQKATKTKKTQSKVTKKKAAKKLASSSESPLGSRLDRTAQTVSAGFIPSVDSRKPTTEEAAPTFGASPDLQINIRVPLPLK